MIKNVNYAVFGCPNFEESVQFLCDFGLVKSAERPGCIYFRGAEERPYLFILKETEKPGLLAVGYEADSEADLRAIAGRLGASVERITDNPWGGLRTITADCDGNQVELVYGVSRVDPLPMREEVALNSGGNIRRKGRMPIFGKDTTPVIHICHVGHTTPDVNKLIDWYVQNLGAYPSDFFNTPETTAACFARFPRGSEYVDHHNVAVFEGKAGGVQHVCFESLDIDAVFLAHRQLKAKGKYRHSWGPIRHSIGGALSDYWLTPWGLRVEHVTDGDVVNDEFETRVMPVCDENGFQWTMTEIPVDFI